MTANITRIRQHIQAFRFEDLFIDELGWDQYRDRLEVVIENNRFVLNAFATKRGMVAFHISSIPEYKSRRKLEQQVAKAHRENIIVYTDPQNTQQVWQWVRREAGKPLANRERQFHQGHTGDNIARVLAGIAFSLAEEDDLTIVDVSSRVRASFDMERVTKRFYDRFKTQHAIFLKFIKGIPDEDLQRWYASVMLNRLMFIYFLQSKNFLAGDESYLRNRLSQTQGNFYREFLCPLFFEGFAKKDHTPAIRRLLGDIPYLNGGLFLQHQIEEQYGDAIQIENEAFEKLFDFLDEYDWHLDDRPLHNDKEINPDVLGYIFEKYINQKQMGAYYTKEDITEYISKNTVIPFLFDQVHKEVKIAFEGDHAIWDLLVENPNRYIYSAVREGTEHALPQNIAVGIEDVSQRGDWNNLAELPYSLYSTNPKTGDKKPTEIWREVVARRQRYADVRGKLERSEVRQINDLITLNLDIQQFAQDVIDYTDSPDVIRAFWKAINSVTVLDPTCGSGAFLFAALNILEPLYEACLERMESFVDELARTGGGRPQQYSDFREVMERIDQHPNRTYFVLKNIIVNNLFGVDIMEEAVEICKLRLFLKLVSQVDDKSKIEPLPDIDFNIRAGNTLVGFATQKEIKANLFAQAVLPQIEVITGTLNTFRKEQLEGNISAEEMSDLKTRIRTVNREIVQVLNQALAPSHGYGVDQIDQFRASHKPFHWYAEFYGVLSRGGFNVVIGNPPYVEYSKVRKEYTIQGYKTERAGNLYAYAMERFVTIAKQNAQVAAIVPLSGFSSARMSEYQNLFVDRFSKVYLSFFSGDAHPAVLFEGVKYRLCIIIGKIEQSADVSIYSTEYYRFYADERHTLFAKLAYTQNQFHSRYLQFAKLGNNHAQALLEKITSQKKLLGEYLERRGKHILHYHRSPNFWIRAMDFEPYFKSPTRTKSEDHVRDLFVTEQTNLKAIGAVLSSTVFYFWFIVQGNCRNLTGENIEDFPLGEISKQIRTQLADAFSTLTVDIRKNSKRRAIEYKLSGLVEYDEFYPRLSKKYMDKIDQVLALHYGFTDEELDFILNYDIKYRMGDDLGDDEDEGEE